MKNNNIINIFDNEKYSNHLVAIPIRIKQARIYRGMTMEELSKKIDVSKQAISKMELGTLVVSPQTLIKISEAVEFPIQFFTKERIVNQNSEDSVIFFRTKRIPAKISNMWNEKIEVINDEIIGYIKSYFKLPKVNLPDISDISDDGNYTQEDIEKIALRLREHWNMGNSPINNLTHIAQKNGIIVIRMSLGELKTDAFSKWKNKIPYVILNSDKNNVFRSRFDLAHEIGHLILHMAIEDDMYASDEIENEAHLFASALLLPEETFSEDIYSITLDSLLPLKKKWKVSVNAITRRCLTLNHITNDRYTSLQKQISMRRWRTEEPFDDIFPVETPKLLKECIEVLIDNHIIDRNTLLNNIPLSTNEICNVFNLPLNYFEDNIINKYSLIKRQ